MKDIVAFVFGLGLIINALLFVPQGWAIWQSRSARGVSTLTFSGFAAMQFIGALHGYFQRDWFLAAGMAVSFLTCGTVAALAFIFRKGPAADLG